MSTYQYLPYTHFKKAMYEIKELLKNESEVTVFAGISASFDAIRTTENLQRLNYATLSNVTTATKVVDGRRKITVSISLKKTKDFDRLYEENEAKRKQYAEEKEKQNQNQDKTPKA